MDEAHILDRAERVLRDRIYAAGAIGWHRLSIAINRIVGEPVDFATARAGTYDPVSSGEAWGTPWSTAWFHVTGEVPEQWPVDDVDLDVDLGWTWGPSTGEALIHTPDGLTVESIGPGRPRIPWRDRTVDIYIEAAANPMPTFDWFPTDSSLGPLPDAPPRMVISRAHLVRVNRVGESAADDMVLALQLAREMSDRARRNQVLRAIAAACDIVDDLTLPDEERWIVFRKALAPVFDNAALPGAPHMYAVANAHIDSAWLWPFRETVRKVARSFSNALAVMDDEPQMRFGSSQVQHLAWMEQFHPHMFERIKQRVAQGEWLLLGGTWVEPDGNMPSGESFARQFLIGQTWLQEHFGQIADTFWLPDTFGYSAGLPQIARAAGCDTFVTQKLSWNSVNVFPYTTLEWEGLDGTRLLTHFPPADSYGCAVLPAELAKSQAKMIEQSADEGLLLFGYGDGGGGPTRDMVERTRRLSIAGLPHIELSTVREFFAAVRESVPEPPVWSGELYLEYHRGTLTSESRIKQLHRRAEVLLRESEMWATAAVLQRGAGYPAHELQHLWRELLLMQFHDVLPGTSIGWVHDEAIERLERVVDRAEALARVALQTVAGDGTVGLVATASPHGCGGIQPLAAVVPEGPPTGSVTAVQQGQEITLDSDRWSVTFTAGLVTSMLDRRSGRQIVAPGGAIGRMRIHPDRPIRYDAWDLDEPHVRGSLEIPVEAAVVLSDETVRVTRSWQDTHIGQDFRLVDEGLEIHTSVDWHAQDCLLRLEADLDVLAPHSDAETMYGFVQRTTTTNTSWEQAKFETCGHRWLHLAEPGYGITVLTPTTYGHQITRQPRDGGGIFTRVGCSLLRSAAFPDPRRDAGRREFRHVVCPGAGIPDAVRLADEQSFGVRRVIGAGPVAPAVHVEGGTVALEALKLAEDGSGDVIVRIRETCGTASAAAVQLCVPATVVECDLIERPVGEIDAHAMRLRPFEVKTLRFRR